MEQKAASLKQRQDPHWVCGRAAPQTSYLQTPSYKQSHGERKDCGREAKAVDLYFRLNVSFSTILNYCNTLVKKLKSPTEADL